MSGEEVRIGLLGLGTVGAAVAEILVRDRSRLAERAGAGLRVTRAAVRDASRRRSKIDKQTKLTEDPNEVVEADDVDVVVELVGGVDLARKWVQSALRRGKPVVTANKALIAAHGTKLHKAAYRRSVGLYYEGAVAGGIPIVRTLKDSLVSDTVTSIRGVLNGTTNFVLGRMQTGSTYEQALADAQALGYAESDPTLDVNGGDAADKLVILMRLAFGVTALRRELPVEGIEELNPEILRDADRLGYRVKLIAVGKRLSDTHIDARVHPALVPAGTALAVISEATNAIRVESRNLGSTFYEGPGAGGFPTGNAVVSDIVEASRNLRAAVVPAAPLSDPTCQLVDPANTEAPFYLRFLVADRPGVLASITQVLSANGISLETVIQRDESMRSGKTVPIVITTFSCEIGAMLRSIRELRRKRSVIKQVSVLRIESEPNHVG